MHTCIICKDPLYDENRTMEHIIPASLGGSLESESIICRTCNSRMGDSLDSTLFEQLQLLIVGFDIANAREPAKGVPPLRYTAPDGKPLVYVPGSSFTTIQRQEFQREQEGDVTHISFAVPFSEKYERLVAKQMDSLKRHYGEDNIIKVETVNEVLEAPPAVLPIQEVVGEQEFLRAVTRSAWNFACYSLRRMAISEPDYTDIREYVLGNREVTNSQSNTIIVGFPTGSHELCEDNAPPAHFVACTVVNGTLWGCVMLFGCLPFVVRIADDPRLPPTFRVSCVLDPEHHTHSHETEFVDRFASYLSQFDVEKTDTHEIVIGTMRAALALCDRGKDATLPSCVIRAYLQQVVTLGLLPANMLISLDVEHENPE